MIVGNRHGDAGSTDTNTNGTNTNQQHADNHASRRRTLANAMPYHS